MKNPWVIIGVLMVVLIGGSVWYSNGVSEKANEGVEVIAHVKGNPDAAVVLVKYSDFQCPACAAFAPAVDEVLSEFGADIRFEYKHFPLIQIHPFAVQAARAAEAAGQQGKFFEYHDALFENLPAWQQSPNPTQLFAQLAEDIDLDMSLFVRHQRSSILQSKVMNEFNEARELGFTGTPTFTLNGERMVYETYPEFRDQIAVAVGSGTSPVVEFGDTETDTPDPAPLLEATVQDEVGTAPVVEFGI